ncbi:bifunctional aspartate kinase/homoserine dehydrogenase I [Candidatus Schneideria nysicola]|uniref:bifunctional aspartate kinase/homoserine dehydrogenase I n=1 Tax=Candidatus Schneideria nysicola TaxID=1081631 RepID=UPI001CAA754E|nr:bifunctional aspartate kinase/homoserine dehydrogenase I [Candidatus Schneideria nysicola]UAJ65172.1 bifunctional aspartate kinase/homoserine dehydrogenase I [Candidatus Schneideria nysicola]
MRVLKFGGTSVADAKHFLYVADIIEQKKHQEQVAVVLSAPAKITNHLVNMVEYTLNGINIESNINDAERIFIELLNGIAHVQPGFNDVALRNIVQKEFFKLKQLLYGIALLQYCPDRVHATIICLGEKLAIAFMEELLIARGCNVTVVNPVEKLLAQGGYLESTVNIPESTWRIRRSSIPNDHIILMAGFTAGNEKSELVVLGRNGSDYSAAVLAACLRANYCEIWTDVDGVYTCDPRKVPEAQLLKSISYQEAMELSYFGAKVLHPRTISPIAQFKIPCLIKNTNNPNGLGTLISHIEVDEANPVKGITHLNNMAMINVSGPGMQGMLGMAARIFASISRAGISVVLITQSSSEYSISFCISQSDVLNACKVLEEEFHLELKNGLLEPIDVIKDLAIISVIGDGMRTQRGLSAKLFSALASAKINIIAIAQGSSERSISVVVEDHMTTTGIRVAHNMLFNINQIIEVFIIGIGGVGQALIDQIHRQQKWLKNQNIEICICGLANSRVSLTNANGINLDNWRTELIQGKEKFHLESLVNLVQKNHLLNPVIVDCTNSLSIAKQYADFLANGFHIVTSNKKANTASMTYYQKIRMIAKKSRKKFLYDTNVGAGLPVIENLQNLLNAGDELIQFSGILSGSLSFIFGKLDEGMSLSEATIAARIHGYTEPDPRDDLSGKDVARKLLILAREVGYELELQDIHIESILPEDLNVTEKKVEDFLLKQLPTIDHIFDTKIRNAHKEGKVLRYIGEIRNNGCCKVTIKSFDKTHPLFSVKDGENALAFYTRYYQPIPLVLRGYGAGHNVTAAGIFADILRTVTWKTRDY